MATYPVVLTGVLDRIQQTLKVKIEDYEDEEEWFEISSDDLEDSDLYVQLRLNWDRIVGIHSDEFALLHCQGGPDSGVWVHYLDDNEHLPGCHRLASW